MKMKTIEINIRKQSVYNDVALASAYTGAKMLSDQDPSAYNRIATTNDDQQALESFWGEATGAVTDIFKPFVRDVSPQPDSHGVDGQRDYFVSLVLPEDYPQILVADLEQSTYRFLVETILARWFRYCNKEAINSYHTSAASCMQDLKNKLYFRPKPIRISPNTIKTNPIEEP